MQFQAAAPNPRQMHPHSLDAFDQGQTSGEFDKRLAQAMDLVENNPDKTSMELLAIGVEQGIYAEMNPNYIRPRLDALIKRYGRVIRPFRRKCTINKVTAFVHRLNHRFTEFKAEQLGVGPTVVHHFERFSESDPDKSHTAIYWSDGTISCTCKGFRAHFRCHVAIGLRLMIDNYISMSDRDYIKKKVGMKH